MSTCKMQSAPKHDCVLGRSSLSRCTVRCPCHCQRSTSYCLLRSVIRYAPRKTVISDTETFVVPGLPDPIEMTRSQLPDFITTEDDCAEYFKRVMDSDYVEHKKKLMGSKVWNVGPVSLCNRDTVDRTGRGKKASVDELECLKWLDSMEPDSFVYLCFGSISRPEASQMIEIASALEASGHPFIWIVKKICDESLPSGFEERMEGKGLIIRGWAPQILILNHPSVGAYVTHCGWNSVLEGVSARLPMMAWPSTAELFCNEKLITEVLKIGVGVGAMKWVSWDEEEKKPLIKREKIEMLVRRVMDGGDEADGMRQRAKELGVMAQRSVKEGWSSTGTRKE